MKTKFQSPEEHIYELKQERDRLNEDIHKACDVIQCLLESASPNKVDHKNMFREWADARAFLEQIKSRS